MCPKKSPEKRGGTQRKDILPPPPYFKKWGGGRSPHVTFVYEKTIFVDFTSNIVKTTYPKIFRL